MRGSRRQLTSPSVPPFGKMEETCASSDSGTDSQKNLRTNPKFIISFSYVYLKFILSYKVKIFIEFYM